MLEYYKLYLPKSDREVKIEVSVPRHRHNIYFDTLYFLDGQNAFKDSHASFGRSIRATKYLGYAASQMNKRILGVAIYNSESDLGRINEYAPFPITKASSTEWLTHDVQNCHNYCDDLITTIIPFIEEKYNTYKDPQHRFIYGSSLAAVTSLYLGINYSDSFNHIAAFSTASFLCEESIFEFLDNSSLVNKNIFLYVGKNELSDDIYDSNVYMDATKRLYEYFKSKGIRVRLVVNSYGTHCEEAWEKHILDFINFIYYEDIFYTY